MKRDILIKIISINMHDVTHIILVQSNDSPIKIGGNFLCSFHNLISVDTSKIVNVIAIGDNFLCYCNKLTIFDTTKLFSLITIGNCFLHNCKELTVFDATKLTSLTTIGYCFLGDCTKLTNFNTIGLISLKHIGDYFLHHCNKNLIVTVKKPLDCLHNELLKINCIITQLYDRPIIHLDNDCVI